MKYLPAIIRILRDYLLITIGTICIAVAVDLFLVPNDVITGGVTGVANILNDLFGTPIGLAVLLLNIPLLIAGFRYLGGFVFGVRTIFATVVLSFAIDLLNPYIGLYIQAPRDPLLYTLYGGILDGFGTGLVFRSRGTTGGVDIVARFLQRWRLEGKGGFTTHDRTVLLSVVAQSEVSLLKAIVRECDPQAFVVFSNVNEVLGEGFKPAFE